MNISIKVSILFFISFIYSSGYSQAVVGEACNNGKCPTGYICHEKFDRCVIATYVETELPCKRDKSIAALAKEMNAPVTFGVGFGVAFGLSGAWEQGVAYHPDGRFACYETSCIGLDPSASFQTYSVMGFFNPGTWDDLAGGSITINTGIEAELPFTDIGVGATSAAILNSSGKVIGAAVGFTAGVGISPLPVGSASVASCDTELTEFTKIAYNNEISLRSLSAAVLFPEESKIVVTERGSPSPIGIIQGEKTKIVETHKSRKILFLGDDKLADPGIMIFDKNRNRIDGPLPPQYELRGWPKDWDPATDAIISYGQQVYFIYDDEVIPYKVVVNDYGSSHVQGKEAIFLKDFMTGWPKTNFTKIDAAFVLPGGNADAYFFKKDKVLLGNMKTKRTNGQKKNIQDVFNGWPSGFWPIDAALNFPDEGKIYFFRGSQYITCDNRTLEITDPPSLIYSKWKQLLKIPSVEEKEVQIGVESIRTKQGNLGDYSWDVNVILLDDSQNEVEALSLLSRADDLDNSSLTITKFEEFSSTYKKNLRVKKEHKYFNIEVRVRSLSLPNVGLFDNIVQKKRPRVEVFSTTFGLDEPLPIEALFERELYIPKLHDIFGDQSAERSKVISTLGADFEEHWTVDLFVAPALKPIPIDPDALRQAGGLNMIVADGSSGTTKFKKRWKPKIKRSTVKYVSESQDTQLKNSDLSKKSNEIAPSTNTAPKVSMSKATLENGLSFNFPNNWNKASLPEKAEQSGFLLTSEADNLAIIIILTEDISLDLFRSANNEPLEFDDDFILTLKGGLSEFSSNSLMGRYSGIMGEFSVDGELIVSVQPDQRGAIVYGFSLDGIFKQSHSNHIKKVAQSIVARL